MWGSFFVQKGAVMTDRNELIKEYKRLIMELYELRANERIKEFELADIEKKLGYYDNALSPRCSY